MTGNEKLCKIYFKKLFFQGVLVFIDLFYRYHYPRHFTYSDCMWRHGCTTCNLILLHSLQKNIFSVHKEFFLWIMAFIRKNKGDVSHLIQIWIQKTLTCILRRYDTIKTCWWNFFKFSWDVRYRKIWKNQVWNRGSLYYFLSSKDKKIKKLNKRDYFCVHSWFHFHGVSHAKTGLHNKYMI